MLLALVLAQALSPIGNPHGPIYSQPSLMNRLAFFEAFPVGGLGTFGVCSTTSPTSAQGSALTFTRASTGTCTKTGTGGLATTGIANGDLVSLSANQSRVEYDSAGTLGLLVEAARTNSAIRSQEVDNASWAKAFNGVSVPTVTADQATAPDGTVTADRVVIAACPTVGQYSIVNQTALSVATSQSATVYLKGNSSSGTISLYSYANGTSSGVATTCSYVSTSWSRCAVSTAHATGTEVGFGCVNLAAVTGSGNTGAADVFVWGGQYEAGAWATSYIPTTTVAVTRAAESAAFTLSTGVGPSGCIAASATWPSGVVAVNIASLGTAGAGNNMTLYRTSNTAAGYQIGVTTTSPAVAAMGTTIHRTVLSDAAGTRAAWWDASSVAAPAASMSGAQTALAVGSFNAGIIPIDGVVSRVQVDPSATRCNQ